MPHIVWLEYLKCKKRTARKIKCKRFGIRVATAAAFIRPFYYIYQNVRLLDISISSVCVPVATFFPAIQKTL